MTAFTLEGKFIAGGPRPGFETFNSDDGKVTTKGIWGGLNFIEGIFKMDGNIIEGIFEGGIDNDKPMPKGKCTTTDIRKVKIVTEVCEAIGNYTDGVRHGQFDYILTQTKKAEIKKPEEVTTTICKAKFS